MLSAMTVGALVAVLAVTIIHANATMVTASSPEAFRFMTTPLAAAMPEINATSAMFDPCFRGKMQMAGLMAHVFEIDSGLGGSVTSIDEELPEQRKYHWNGAKGDINLFSVRNANVATFRAAGATMSVECNARRMHDDCVQVPEQRLLRANDLCIGMVSKGGQDPFVIALSESRSAGCRLVLQLASEVAAEML